MIKWKYYNIKTVYISSVNGILFATNLDALVIVTCKDWHFSLVFKLEYTVLIFSILSKEIKKEKQNKNTNFNKYCHNSGKYRWYNKIRLICQRQSIIKCNIIKVLVK